LLPVAVAMCAVHRSIEETVADAVHRANYIRTSFGRRPLAWLEMSGRGRSGRDPQRTGTGVSGCVVSDGSRLAVCATAMATLLAICACGSGDRSHPAAAVRPRVVSTASASSDIRTRTHTAATPDLTAAPATSRAATHARTTGRAVPHPTTTGASRAIAACRTSHLSLSLIRGGAAAGTAYLWYGLRNAGAATCSMVGYPRVAVLNARGEIVQHAATRGAALPARVRLVALKPGQRARFLLNSTDTVPSPGCLRAYRGVSLRVFPPNQATPILKPFKGAFCNLRVGPIEPAG